ncbi:hypothetical protein [Archangium lansingense]|uniref:Secreted protein n=1 Tax=Archangium lansingense TaxID=2995310 RepID=A0ABT4AB19_9BACT|nr:hypothetical protein [Archangium lansinium]MCY1078820.1 hypothetical protein [Archangium lansinium]
MSIATSPSLTQALVHLMLLGAVTAPTGVLAGTHDARAHATSASHAHHTQEDTDMYRTDVQMHPTPVQADQPVTLTITVRDGHGRAVSQLTPSHEKPMHLLVISKDLSHFAHLHPFVDGASFRAQHTFEEAGAYFLFVDYQQPGRGQVVDRHSVHVAGAARPAAVALTESPRTQRADGLELTLRSVGEIRGGEAATLHFDVTDVETGKPVGDLEPYLGAMAHFMVLSADGQDFVHVHALDTRSASRVSAHAVFPRPGLYKLWVQVQRRGAVVTVPFVLRVGVVDARPEARSGSGPKAPGGHAHHQH